jgi:hypothetical protein
MRSPVYSASRIDGRRRQPELEDDQVHPAATPAEAVQIALRLIPQHPKRSRAVR